MTNNPYRIAGDVEKPWSNELTWTSPDGNLTISTVRGSDKVTITAIDVERGGGASWSCSRQEALKVAEYLTEAAK